MESIIVDQDTHLDLAVVNCKGLTIGASQKSASPIATHLLNSYLVNLLQLVNQNTFMGPLLY